MNNSAAAADDTDTGGWRRAHVVRAGELLSEILGGRGPADRVMEGYFRRHREMGGRDRGRVAEAVYACLRRRRLYAEIAERAGEDPANPIALLCGYLVKELGFSGRALARLDIIADPLRFTESARTLDPAALPFAVRVSLPDWLAEALVADLGPDEAGRLAEALNAPAPLDLRVNTLKTSRGELIERLAAAGFSLAPTPWSPVGLRQATRAPLFSTEAFREGLFEVQDEGSQLIALLIDPHRRETVVDFCAGGGGKTLHLGALLENTGSLYACDVSVKRLERLRPRLRRAGLHNVRTLALSDEQDAQLGGLRGVAQRVLVDAPCSGTGTLRRNPDIKWRDLNLPGLMATQDRILAAAAELVKSGGRLVYATCSVLADENEARVDAFLKARPAFRRLDAAAVLARHGVVVPDAVSPAGDLRLYPHRHATDGFYAAVLERAP